MPSSFSLSAFVLALCAFLPMASAQPAGEIAITNVPVYGSAGVLTGVVSGVDFTQHRVAVYVQPEGAGWWGSKPFFGATVPISGLGTFSVSLGTAGLDEYATHFAAVLLPTGVTPTNASASSSVPPSMLAYPVGYVSRYGETLEWAGRTWAVKKAPLPAGPGSNLFCDDPGAVWVDAAGRLHLTIHQLPSGAWCCSEVVLLESLGHGTYWFTTETDFDGLDENVTAGFFTWDPFGDDFSVPLGALGQHREIDFEASRWTVASSPVNLQYVVQPFSSPRNISHFASPASTGSPTLTTWFDWQPGSVSFGTAIGRQHPCTVPPAALVHEFTFVHDPALQHYVPTPGRETVRINAWLNNKEVTGSGTPQPANGQPVEIIVSDFRFSPMPQALAYGSHVNPEGSLTITGGASVGSAVTFAVDNPLGTQTSGSMALLAVSLAPDPAYPAGTQMPAWGMDGGVGELLISTPTNVILGGSAWAGPGQPVLFPVGIPPVPTLAGLVVYVQGGMVDLVGGGVARGLTEAIEVCVAP